MFLPLAARLPTVPTNVTKYPSRHHRPSYGRPTSERVWTYSHSIVPGGLEVTSGVTRLVSRTSLVIRVELRTRGKPGADAKRESVEHV